MLVSPQVWTHLQLQAVSKVLIVDPLVNVPTVSQPTCCLQSVELKDRCSKRHVNLNQRTVVQFSKGPNLRKISFIEVQSIIPLQSDHIILSCTVLNYYYVSSKTPSPHKQNPRMLNHWHNKLILIGFALITIFYLTILRLNVIIKLLLF